MDGNPLQWRWVNELGVHNAVDARELVDALLTGRMTPHVWVWRTGWKSWIRASQVADLATAIPKGARLPAVAIAIDPAAVEPPPMPRYSFRPSTRMKRTSTPVPPAMQQRPLLRRPATPTLVEAPQDDSHQSHTLRPPGAVPPPPRTFSGAFAFDVQRALDLANFASDDTAHEKSTSLAPDLVMRSVLGGSEPSRAEVAPAAPAIVATAEVPTAGAEVLADTRSNSVTRRRRLLLTIGFSCIAAVALVAVVARNRDESKRVAGAPLLAQAASASQPMQPCRLIGAAERLAPSIALSVAPIVATATDGKSIAVGFADTANSAAGIVVDPVTRSVKYVFREADNSRVTSVVPKVQGSQLSFAVARDKDVLKEARLVPGAPDFTFGQTVEGFARKVGAAAPETVWPTDIDTPCTGARLVTVPGLGHAVTYRQGGQSGTIQVGWLTPDGRSRVAPWSVQTDAKSVGQPNIAESGSQVLVTFAGRTSDAEPWAPHVVLVPADGQGGLAQRLPTVAGGPGGDAISPAAAGLGGGRFILQWSEGGVGHRQIRVQTLDAQLQPRGPAVTVSPADANAGQGVLWVNGAALVSLFVVNAGRSAEFWAASLNCPQ